MMYSEFLTLTGRKVSYEKYTQEIEPEYMASPLTKQEFCAQYIAQTARPRKKQNTGNNWEIEIQRHNVTLSQFLAMVKFECKKKGIDFSIDKEEFINPSSEYNYWYCIKDGKKIVYNDGHRSEWDIENAACESEAIKNKPYEMQTYILNFDGSLYNEILEFNFWDDKKGHGYYYQANRDTTK